MRSTTAASADGVISIRQADDRHVAGFETEYRRNLQTSIPTEITVGFQNRYDDIDVGLYLTEQRAVFDTVRDDNVEQSLNSLYASLHHQWTDRFRSVAAVRADHYTFDVDTGITANSGAGSDTMISPKLNLVYSPMDGLETFLSAGQGFHSNDARGTVISVDPASGDDVDAVDPLATARRRRQLHQRPAARCWREQQNRQRSWENRIDGHDC